MGLLAFVALIAIVIIIGGYLSIQKDKENKAAEQKERDRETLETVSLIKRDLEEKNEANNQRMDAWKEWHENHADLGVPTTYVGFSILEGWPWERKHVNLIFDDRKSPDNQLDDVLNGDACLIPYLVPDFRDCALFFKDARTAFIGGRFFNPEEIRFVKSRTDKENDQIIVTVTTTSLDCPTFTMEFGKDDRDDVDELKAAINAFKLLPQ